GRVRLGSPLRDRLRSLRGGQVFDDLLILAWLKRAGAAGSIANHASHNLAPIGGCFHGLIDAIEAVAAAAALIYQRTGEFHLDAGLRALGLVLRGEIRRDGPGVGI